MTRAAQTAIVIGGGIAGLTVAAELAERGLAVTLFEREAALGTHASGRSAAMFEPGYGPPAVQALSAASEGPLREGGILSPRGLMLVARANETAVFRAECQQMQLNPIPLAQAFAQVPILDQGQVAHAAVSNSASDLDTDRLLQAAARRLRAAGGQIVTGAEVSAIRRNSAGWTVDAGQNATADLLVNAAGAWADQIAQLAGIAPIGLQPRRRSMALLPAPAGHDVTDWPMLMGVDEGWYAKPDAGNWLVSPSEADPVPPSDAWPDDMVIAEGLARYEAMVTVPLARITRTWAGLRSFAPDGVPVLGPEPGQPGFIWCAAQGGYGFQTAPAAAQLTAELALARPTGHSAQTVAALTPARFR